MPSKPRRSAEKRELKAAARRVAAAPNGLPDLALQFKPCLEDLVGTLGPNVVENVTGGIRSRLGDEADVHYRCLNLTGFPRTGTIGIWMSKPADFLDGLVRADSLRFVKPLRRGGSCWMYVNSNFMQRELQKVFDEVFDARKHRLTPDGDPDENGPIHIFAPTLAFESPSTVVTTVPGHDDRGVPDVKFRIELTDTLKVEKLQIQCESKKSLDADTSLLNILTAAGLTFFFPAGVAFLIQRIKVGRADPPPLDGGIGAAAAEFFGPAILVSGRKKVSFTYDDIQADRTGLKTQGVQEIVERSPAARITGPTNLKIRTQKFASGTFNVVTTDLLPGLRFHWTVSSSGFSANTTTNRKVIQFSRGSTPPGGSFTRTVRVTVTDADGLTASASHSVRIQIVDPEEEEKPPPKFKSPKPEF